MACSVLRCGNPSAQPLDIRNDDEAPLMQVGLCDGHFAAIKGGAPWHAKLLPGASEWGAAELRVLMDDDFPLVYKESGIGVALGGRDHVEVSLTLTRGDGTEEVVDFLVPPDKLDDFAGRLRLFSRGA
jgi:hypothetical protein